MSKSKKPTKSQANVGFDAKKYERPGLSADEIEEIKEAFDLFDPEGTFAIPVSELTSSMRSLGFHEKNPVIYNMIMEMDANGNGEIEFDEFLDMMTARISDKNPVEDLERVYKLFDADRTGEITVADLKRVAKELGEDIPDSELAEIIERADLNNDSHVDINDFIDVVTKKGASN